MADPLIPLATTDEKDISMVGPLMGLDEGAPIPEPEPAPASEPPRALTGDNDYQYEKAEEGYQYEKDESLPLKENYDKVKGTDPARNAEVLKTSEETGEDPAYVDRNLEEIQKQKGLYPESKLEEIHKNSPKTAKWLEDPANMALVHDDLEQLPEIERLVAERTHGQDYLSGDPAERYSAKRYPDLEIGINNLLMFGGRVPGGVVAAELAMSNAIMAHTYPNEKAAEVPKWLVDNHITRKLEAENKFLLTLTPGSLLTASDEFLHGNFSQAADTAMSKFIQNAPTMMALMASGIFQIPGGLAAMGFGATGQTYKENKDKGQEERWAQANAVGIGLIEYAFERWSWGTLSIIKSSTNAVARKYGEQTAKQVITDFGKTLASHFGKEGTSEGLTGASQRLWNYATDADPHAFVGTWKEIAKRVYKDVTESVDDFVVGGMSGFAMSAPAATSAGIARAQQVQQVKKDLKTYQDMGKAVERLKVTDVNRPAVANLLAQATEGTDIQEAFLDPNKIDLLFQTETKGGKPSSDENPHAIKATNAVEFAAEMGILKEYEEAKATNHKIKIPYAKFLEKLVKTNYYSALENDITFDAKKASHNEMVEDQKRADELEKQAASAETPEQKRAAEIEVGLDAHRKARITEFMAAGQSMTSARANAEAEINRIKKRADDMVKDPLEVAKGVHRVVAVDKVPDGALEQAAPNIRRVDDKQYSYDEVLDSAKRTGNDAEYAELGRHYGNYPKSERGHAQIDMPPTAPRPNFSLIEVPVGLLFRPYTSNNVETPSDEMHAESESDEENAQRYAKLPAETAEPILVELKDGAIKVKDGRHRARAAFLRGDSHVKAFIESSQLDEVLTGKSQDLLFQKDNLPAVIQQPNVSPLGFVSQVEVEVLKMDFKSMPAKDLLGRIENIQGIKKEELEWMGLREYLEAKAEEAGQKSYRVWNTTDNVPLSEGHTKQFAEGELKYHAENPALANNGKKVEMREQVADGKVTKDELLDFIRSNGVKVEQVVLAEDFNNAAVPRLLPERNRSDGDLPLDTDLSWDAGVTVPPSTDWINDEMAHILGESGMSAGGDHNYFGEAWGERTEEFLPSILEELDLEYEKDEDGKPLLEIEWAKPGREGQSWAHYSRYPVDIGGVKFSDSVTEKSNQLRRIKDKLESELAAEFDHAARDAARENYYQNSPDEKFTERETGYELVGNGESGEYYCPDNNRSYSGNINEAKIELAEWLLEYGKIETQETRYERHAAQSEHADDDNTGPVPGVRYTLPIGPQPAPDVNSPTGSASYSSYAIPGGTNYREILLKLPKGQRDGDFTQSHHRQENILAFTRVTDRVDAEGRKTLMIEELQSDWNQKGWKHGFKGEPKTTEELDLIENRIQNAKDRIKSNTNQLAELRKSEEPEETKRHAIEDLERLINNDRMQLYLLAQESRSDNENKVPDGPFIRNEAWIALGVKRLIRMAVEQGYDAIAWFPADVHTERWGTSNISWAKKDVKTFDIMEAAGVDVIAKFYTEEQAKSYKEEFGKGMHWSIRPPVTSWVVSSTEQRGGNFNGMNLEEAARQRGLLLERQGKRVTTKDELIELLKKTSRDDEYSPALSDSIWKQMQEGDSGSKEPRREFYENLYNKKVPKAFEAALKKLDKNAKAEPNSVMSDNGTRTTRSIKLTPELKAASQKGLPLFQQESTITRGFYDRMKKIIGLLPSANWSTLLHESAHAWFQEMDEDVTELQARDASTLTDKQRALIDDANKLLAWLGASSFKEVTDEQQEKFARAMEAYFSEGNAPSKELKSVFTRFAKWLTKLGRTMKGLNVEMSPEIADVFGRFIATQEQMDRARAETNDTNEAGTFGAKGDKAGAILQAWSAAKDYADDEFEAEVIADIKRKQSATYREQRQIVEDEVIKEVNAEPVYQAIAYLSKGTYSDGKPLEPGIVKLKLSKKILNKMFKPAQLEKLPHGISHNKEGVHPDTVATMLGFRNGTEMVLQMVMAEKKADLINRLTDERMKKRFPGLLDEPEVSEKAMEALHNDKKSRLLRLQLEALAEHDLPKLMEAGKMLIRRVPSDEQVRTQARNTINGKKMSDIRPIIYQRAEVRASRMAAEAYAKGDIPGAFEHKRNEIYNHQLYLEAKKVQKFQEKAEKLFVKASKSDDKLAKSYNMDMVNAARAVLATYGIGDETATPESFLKAMAENDKDTYEVISALVGYATQSAKNFDDMTYEEYDGLFLAVNALWELARNSRKFTTLEESLELEVVREAIVASLSEYTKKNAGRMNRTSSDKDKRRIGFLGLKASLRRVEPWADRIGGKNSALSKYFVMPLIDAIAQYRIKRNEVTKRLIEIIEPFKGEANGNLPIVADELSEGFQFENIGRVMGAIAHSGNDSNLFKMLRGESTEAYPEGWGGLDAEGNLDRSKWQAFMNRMYAEGKIQKRHMDAIQQIWDLFEEIKPYLQKAHKQMYGHYFSEITANEIVTPFGVYRGGYMPAIGDPLRSIDASMRSDADDHFESVGSQLPQLNRGMTKQRLNNYATPLHMDLRLVPYHMDKALKLAFIGPAYKQAYRLMKDSKIRAALNAYDPGVFKDMIEPWLERIASQSAVTPSKTPGFRWFDKIWAAARTRTGMQLMPGNVPNIIEQGFGVIVANAKVDMKYLSGSFFHYRKEPTGYGNWIRSKSDWMKTTIDDSAFELNARLEELNGATGKTWEWAQLVKKHAYIGQVVMQAYVNNIVWGGAYNQSVAEGRTEKQSIAAADKAVRLTQGTFNVEDISNMETGSPFGRMFTHFMTYFNMVLNLSWTGFQQIHDDFGITSGKGSLKALGLFSVVFWIPSVLGLVLKRGFAGDLGEDDDGDGTNIDDILWMLVEAPRDLALATIPVLGPAAKMLMVNYWNDKFYDDRMPTAPALSVFDSAKAIKTVPKAIFEDGDPATAVRDAATLIGLLTGLPLKPLSNPIVYQIKKDQGESKRENALGEAAGYLTGKPGK